MFRISGLQPVFVALATSMGMQPEDPAGKLAQVFFNRGKTVREVAIAFGVTVDLAKTWVGKEWNRPRKLPKPPGPGKGGKVAIRVGSLSEWGKAEAARLGFRPDDHARGLFLRLLPAAPAPGDAKALAERLGVTVCVAYSWASRFGRSHAMWTALRCKNRLARQEAVRRRKARQAAQARKDAAFLERWRRGEPMGRKGTDNANRLRLKLGVAVVPYRDEHMARIHRARREAAHGAEEQTEGEKGEGNARAVCVLPPGGRLQDEGAVPLPGAAPIQAAVQHNLAGRPD